MLLPRLRYFLRKNLTKSDIARASLHTIALRLSASTLRVDLVMMYKPDANATPRQRALGCKTLNKILNIFVAGD